eukprot:c12972_g1_i1 orf=43-399(+)
MSEWAMVGMASLTCPALPGFSLAPLRSPLLVSVGAFGPVRLASSCVTLSVRVSSVKCSPRWREVVDPVSGDVKSYFPRQFAWLLLFMAGYSDAWMDWLRLCSFVYIVDPFESLKLFPV